MSRKEEILSDKVYIVGGKLQEELQAPNGIVFPEEVEGLQKEFFNFSIEHLTSTLVDVKKEYPIKDTMKITVSADFVVMRREDFDELMTLDIEVEEPMFIKK